MEQIAEARNRRFKYSNNYFPYKYETLSYMEITKDYIDNIDNNLTEEERLEIIQINENILKSLDIKYVDLKGLHPIRTDEITQSIVKAYYRYPKIIESIVCIHTSREESIRNTFAKTCYDYIVEWYRIYKPSVTGEELKTKIDEYVNKSVKDKIDYVINNKVFTASCSYFGNLEEDKIPIQNVIVYRIYNNVVNYYKDNYDSVKNKYHPDKVYGETGNTIHELGHVINNMLAIDKLDEIKNLYNTNNNKNMKDLLSEYAETNIKEFIAEAWAEYILSNNPRELSIKVGDIIDREYRNKFGSIIHKSF